MKRVLSSNILLQRRHCRRCRRPRQWSKRLFAVVTVLTSLALMVAPGCKKKLDDRQRIEKLIHDGADAVGRRDLSTLMDLVAKDFGGQIGPGWDGREEGGINRKQLRLLLFRFLRRRGAPRVAVRSIEVRVKGGTATARTVLLLGKAVGDEGLSALAPARGEAMRLDLELLLEDDHWRVSTAKRTRVDAKTLILGK